MSSPGSFAVRRPSMLTRDENHFPVPTRSGALASLLQHRSTPNLSTSYSSSVHRPDDDEAALESSAAGVGTGTGAAADLGEDGGIGRLLLNEHRLGQLLQGPHARSMNLIGKTNPRYRWDRYFKPDKELANMKKPIRKYYERTNELIEQYMYIDLLLDSAIPHQLLSEYGQELESSAFRPMSIPPTIAEQDVSSASLPSQSLTSEPPARGYGTSTPTEGQSQPKRTPKDIFRSPESMPLLQHADQDGDEPEPRQTTPPNQDGSPKSPLLEPETAPKPRLAWLEDADIDSDDPIVTYAIWINMIANIVLLIGKVIVVASVPSLSVLASLVDAVLDFLSTAIVWTTTRLISSGQKDQYQWPVGRRRLEPVGVLVFSIIMITSFVQVALEAIQRLAKPEHVILELGIPAIAIMVGTIVIKGACWLWCRLVRNSSVRALAEDAKTDVIFNTGSILFPIVGFYGRVWWLDALGGLILSCVVIINWGQTSAHHVRNLTGFSATPDERNLLLYLTMRFATAIRKIQNLRAYHAGDKLFVEADIVLSANTPLKDSHDVSELLTYFLESVPIVDRAFVHVDYLDYNQPTHMLK